MEYNQPFPLFSHSFSQLTFCLFPYWSIIVSVEKATLKQTSFKSESQIFNSKSELWTHILMQFVQTHVIIQYVWHYNTHSVVKELGHSSEG